MSSTSPTEEYAMNSSNPLNCCALHSWAPRNLVFFFSCFIFFVNFQSLKFVWEQHQLLPHDLLAWHLKAFAVGGRVVYENSLITLPTHTSLLITTPKMSHRKVRSQGSVPFSWEDSPGVSKAAHQECPANIGIYALNLPLPPPPPPSLPPSNSPPQVSIQNVKIPLPPCPDQPPLRRTSSKGLWGQEEDPFLAAYKECTKSVESAKKPKESKKGFGFGRRKCKFTFSCKHSCEVEDDSWMRLTHLPPLPKVRAKVRGLRWDWETAVYPV